MKRHDSRRHKQPKDSRARFELSRSVWFTPYSRLRRAMRIEKRKRPYKLLQELRKLPASAPAESVQRLVAGMKVIESAPDPQTAAERLEAMISTVVEDNQLPLELLEADAPSGLNGGE